MVIIDMKTSTRFKLNFWKILELDLVSGDYEIVSYGQKINHKVFYLIKSKALYNFHRAWT